MQAQLEETHTAEPIEEQRARLGELLGLDEPAPADVLVSAIEDREYARNLMLCKDTPPLRDFLLQNPPLRAEPPPGEAPEKSARELLGAASKSFWAWTRSGFSVVDEETYERRFGTCLECPHLVDPPSRGLYKVIGATGSDVTSKICELCGCVASRKARLPTDTCPAPHAELEGVNKWGEPLPVAAA
jgi:hypothetical protein